MALSESRYLLHNGTGKGQPVFEKAGGAGAVYPNRLSAGDDAYGTELSNGWLYCFVANKWGWVDTRKSGFDLEDRGAPPSPPPDPDTVPDPTTNPLTEQLVVDMMENHVVRITFQGNRIFPQ